MDRMKLLLLLSFGFCLGSSLSAQTIDSMMMVYADQIPQQKIHVHFDKNIYKAGESIYFKAYVFAGYQPASNSKTCLLN